jgi:hypothetical protein
MAETAAYVVDHVLPRVPIRQWVLAVPKRIRWFVQRNRKVASRVLTIFIGEVEGSRRIGVRPRHLTYLNEKCHDKHVVGISLLSRKNSLAFKMYKRMGLIASDWIHLESGTDMSG